MTYIYSHKSYRSIFHHLYWPKVIKTGLHKLSGLRCMSYHAIHTKKFLGDVSSTPTPTPKLSGLSYISYQICDIRVIRSMMCELPCCSHKKLLSGCFINSPLTPTPARKLIGCYQLETHETRYHDDCTWVIGEIQRKRTRNFFHFFSHIVVKRYTHCLLIENNPEYFRWWFQENSCQPNRNTCRVLVAVSTRILPSGRWFDSRLLFFCEN